MSSFRYNQLKEMGSIRLLLLQPSLEYSSPIHCSLVQANVFEAKHDIIDQYTALSYVWGDQKTRLDVFIDGHTVSVTETLFLALRDLRDERRVLRLWADAICINQSDLEEKSSQVHLMGSIYHTAQHTIIHLGVGTPELNAALETLRLRAIGCHYDFASNLKTLKYLDAALLSRPWFTRVWIFQELVLSLDPWIQCGRVRVQWDDFSIIMMRLVDDVKSQYRHSDISDVKDTLYIESLDETSSDESPTQTHPTAYTVFRSMQRARAQFHGTRFIEGSPKLPLIDVLKARRGLGVTHAVDMVYAHLGMATPPLYDRIDWRVDYLKSASQVYTKIAMAMIFETSSLSILCLVSNIEPSLRKSGFPSWVPDWSVPLNISPRDVNIASLSMQQTRRKLGSSNSKTKIYSSKLLGEALSFFAYGTKCDDKSAEGIYHTHVPVRLALSGNNLAMIKEVSKSKEGTTTTIFDNFFSAGPIYIPSFTNPGDLLCAFEDKTDANYLFVLRPIESARDRVLERDIRQTLFELESDDIVELDSFRVSDVVLIGLAWVRGFIPPINSRNEVFVLH